MSSWLPTTFGPLIRPFYCGIFKEAVRPHACNGGGVRNRAAEAGRRS